MRQRSRAMRRVLFTSLSTCADINVLLKRYTDVVLPVLAALLDQGRSLFQEATAHARKVMRDHGILPVIDAVKVDTNNHIIDTFFIPLLPIMLHEDSARFFAHLLLPTRRSQ